MFRKILVAMDCSETGKYVFDEALSLAKAFQGNLMLLHVLTIEEEGLLYTPVMLSSQACYPMVASEKVQKVYQQQRETLIAQGIELLKTRADEGIAAGVTTEFTQILGNPSRTICDFAHNWGADLIVVGRRGLSGFNEFILGSVSNYVLHHAKCSVLTVQHSLEESI